jgi:hypothetical protein
VQINLVKSQMTFDFESRQEGVIHVLFPNQIANDS